MATSTIPAVKGAIYNSLLALTVEGAALENVDVTWGIPAQAPEEDWILLGDVSSEQSAPTIERTRQPREENYTLTVECIVQRSILESPKFVCDRAYALAAEIETLVRPLTQPPLGVTGVLWIQITKTDLREAFDAQIREAVVEVSLTAKARI